MTKLKLYFDFLSQPSRVLYLFMKKTEIPFEAKSLNLRQGKLHRKQHTKAVIGNFVLFSFSRRTSHRKI